MALSYHPIPGLKSSLVLPLKGTSNLTGALSLTATVMFLALRPVNFHEVAKAMSLFVYVSSMYLLVPNEVEETLRGTEIVAAPIGEM